jgi:hypothetical protein
MEVSVEIVRHEKIEISDRQAVDIAMDIIKRALDLPKIPTIKDGKLIKHWEEYGHTTRFESAPVRDASEDEVAALRVMDKLEEFKRKS